MKVVPISSREATAVVLAHHYLHRAPPISICHGLLNDQGDLKGVITFGVPASHHMMKGACPEKPGAVLELNRLWVHDDMPRNTESWFVARSLAAIKVARIVLSYADTSAGHVGYIYRASNFYYAGWTDMDRKTPRFDDVAPGKHSRDAFRNGWTEKVRRKPKVKYWTVTGAKRERRELEKLCRWPKLSWKTNPPPVPQ
jgi:hypothetical protein